MKICKRNTIKTRLKQKVYRSVNKSARATLTLLDAASGTINMMFYKVRCIILSFITIFYCVKGDTLIKINQKRHSVTDNYQLCLESFDIHSDKIIKTQDSIAMGAAYLTSLNADSRSDCLRYCCETDRCDVFIFEEKVLIVSLNC